MLLHGVQHPEFSESFDFSAVDDIRSFRPRNNVEAAGQFGGAFLTTTALTAGAGALGVSESAATGGIRFIVGSGGETSITIRGIELSTHAAKQATGRMISLEEISNTLENGYSFSYYQDVGVQIGYYHPGTNTFVGIGQRITTVMNPSNPSNYLRNLTGRGP